MRRYMTKTRLLAITTNLVIIAMMVITAERVLPTMNIAQKAFFSFGMIQAIAGQFYFIFVKKWSGELVPHELWTGGPFRFVRHPFYGGILIMMLTFSIPWLIRPVDLDSLFYIIPMAAFIGFLFLISISQEKDVIAKHGDAARAYYKKVRPRFIPFLF